MRERLLADWPLKALALVIAFGIWVSITGQDRTLRDLIVPLEIDFGPERIAGSPPPTAVTIRLEGPRTKIRKLDPLRLAVRIDLQDSPFGEREVPLSRSHLEGVPRGVDVSLFDPDRVRLTVERRARREMEIVPDLAGRPAEGYALYGFLARPTTAVVEGPLQAVDAMDGLATAPIPLDGHTDTFVASVGVMPEDPRVRVLDADGVDVEVYVDVAPVEAVFDDVKVEVPVASGPARVRPSTVRVTLAGPAWLLERVQPTQILAVAEPREDAVRGARAAVRVTLRLDEREKALVSVRSVRPSHVAIHPSDQS